MTAKDVKLCSGFVSLPCSDLDPFPPTPVLLSPTTACILIVQCITKPIVHYLFRRQCIIFKFLGFNISPQGGGGLLNYITLGWAGWRNFRAASKRIGLLRKLNHLAVYDSTILHCFRINPTWTKTFTNPPHLSEARL